ncbi:MAG: sigma-70 family RNA polymerase sigma factor [Clostridiales bacterium]|nr:sigma-70 family RNA polymerase sigma factor [Clostridiales bacterium]
MANKDKQRFFPLRDPENPFKVTLTPITEEQYRSIYPDIWATQKREQYHGRCMCPYRFIWKCSGDCIGCEYPAAGDITSLDQPLPDGNGTLGDYVPDNRPSIEDITADRDLLKRLMARFRELDPDADRIIQMRLDNPKISDRKIAEALGRPQRTFADQMKRIYTELHKIEKK